MGIPYYHVDAFTGSLFSGNPAGVCLLADWLPDGVLQSIAAENNLAETAFVVQRDSYFDLRWFTPALEMDLFCEHRGERVGITGRAVTYSTGFLHVF